MVAPSAVGASEKGGDSCRSVFVGGGKYFARARKGTGTTWNTPIYFRQRGLINRNSTISNKTDKLKYIRRPKKKMMSGRHNPGIRPKQPYKYAFVCAMVYHTWISSMSGMTTCGDIFLGGEAGAVVGNAVVVPGGVPVRTTGELVVPLRGRENDFLVGFITDAGGSNGADSKRRSEDCL
jgi:hypothetical protein